MADGESRVKQQTVVNEAERLKYLGFVQRASLHAIMCFSNLFEYAKDKSGPLKPGIESVEGTVKTVVGPVCDKFHAVPIELVKFMDRKMDELMTKMDSRVPPKVKQVSEQAISAAQCAPVVARSVASEVQRAGVANTAKNMYAKYEPTAKELYSKYEPVAESYAIYAWHYLNRLPVFPQLAQVMVPTAAYCSEKYNLTVKSTAGKGYRFANYLPLVPTERIAKVFSTDYGSAEYQPLDTGRD